MDEFASTYLKRRKPEVEDCEHLWMYGNPKHYLGVQNKVLKCSKCQAELEEKVELKEK